MSEIISFQGKNLVLDFVAVVNIRFPNRELKDAVKSVLRIGSAHNKGGPADIN